MSSYSSLLLDTHLYDLTTDRGSGQLRLSRRAAERFATLQAVRDHRAEGRSIRVLARRTVGQRLQALLAARSRARQGTSPA